MILVLRADSPEVTVAVYDGHNVKSEKRWQAGRELSAKILHAIDDICLHAETKKEDLDGFVVYEGPGSYTGLRISISVGNALAYAHNIPIAGASGDSWIQSGLSKLESQVEFTPVNPVYGGEVYTTNPKK